MNLGQCSSKPEQKERILVVDDEDSIREVVCSMLNSEDHCTEASSGTQALSILAAGADFLDAITSDRPYRAAQSFQAARDEIVRWAGRQFDPEIVKIFLSIPPNTWCQLREEINRDLSRAIPLRLQSDQYSGIELQSTSA